MFLTRISVGQPVFAAMVMVAITSLGSVELLAPRYRAVSPDIDFPVVGRVVVPYPGGKPRRP
jgi:HAE1 family hydrophobic/amphiphilic exporter-1